MIPQEVIDEIKSRTDVLEVVGDYVNLKKNGSNFRGYSPFNNERTPSFYVVPSKGFFKDFSSGKAGDAITFLMDAEGMSYVEAIKHLAKKYGIDIPEEEATDEELEARNERDSVFIVMKYAAEYFQKNLWKHEEGKSIGLTYLRERGFSDEIIETFSLGYSLDQWDGLMQSALKKGYQKEYLAKAGLIIQKEESNKEYDRFRGRVMFPVHNISGRVLAFGARVLGKADKQRNAAQPKYINSPETLIYHKSDVLYGLYQAKQYIRQEDNCYLVEGYTDVIALYQAGVRNAVASSGTSLTQEQIRLIGRYTQNVTVLFDSDPAGLKASFRGIDMILEGGLQVKAVTLPEGDDPDSLSRRMSATELQTYLKEHRADFISFKTQVYQREAEHDPIRQAELIREVVASIAKVPDPIQRQVYVKATSTQLEIDEQTLVTEMNKIHRQQARTSQRRDMLMEEETQSVPESELVAPKKDIANVQPSIYFKEREIIRVLVLYGQQPIQVQESEPATEGSEEALEIVKVYDYIYYELEDITIQTQTYAEIYQFYREQTLAGATVTEAWLVEHGSEEVKKEVIDLVVDHYVLSENWELLHEIFVTREQDILHQVIQRGILELKFAYLGQLMGEQRQKLKETTDEVDQFQILKNCQMLKQSQQEIAKVLGIVVG
ncbi:DNA primase [Tunicatimonas pelagia]|uniref:DNA primase n=1 Tax=Tunicatimonas pelagia TaxID=931531 RepID=UPI002666707E|nr:DNA primase [Tunicatimonas pelagia]WKN43058.1 DNA primase [Tunicatimonas pelagia]